MPYPPTYRIPQEYSQRPGPEDKGWLPGMSPLSKEMIVNIDPQDQRPR